MTTAPAAPGLHTSRPFTTAAALAAGLSPATLSGPRYRRILHGVYVSAAVPPGPLERVEAALLIHPSGAFASHTSAARAHRLPLPERLVDEHVTVRVRTDRRSRRGVRSHLAGPGARSIGRGGLPVSPPTQLFIEMAGLLDLVELVVLGDALVRLHEVTPEDLRKAAAESRDRHARAARRAAGFVRAEVESPMESRLRMLIVLAGLPEPEVNVTVYRADGRVRYRFDLAYRDIRLAVEYDGRHHRADLDQWDHDNERDDWLDLNGWMVVKVVARGIYVDPEHTLRRIRRALRARGLATRGRLRDEWRPFFPGRIPA